MRPIAILLLALGLLASPQTRADVPEVRSSSAWATCNSTS